jgi:hypothetical protein
MVEQFRTERVTEYHSVGLSFDFYPAINVMCYDRLEVPVFLELSTQDGVLEFAIEGLSSIAAANPEREASYAEGSRDMDPEELPVFDEDPADYESIQLQLGLSAVDGVRAQSVAPKWRPSWTALKLTLLGLLMSLGLGLWSLSLGP